MIIINIIIIIIIVIIVAVIIVAIIIAVKVQVIDTILFLMVQSHYVYILKYYKKGTTIKLKLRRQKLEPE